VSINLEEFRKRNAKRKVQTKCDVDTLIDLVEELHDALLNGGHSHACDMERRLNVEHLCSCGLDDLIKSVEYDFRIRIRRKHVQDNYGEKVPLAAIYEPEVKQAYQENLLTNRVK
jgi:hypothetical protein